MRIHKNYKTKINFKIKIIQKVQKNLIKRIKQIIIKMIKKRLFSKSLQIKIWIKKSQKNFLNEKYITFY